MSAMKEEDSFARQSQPQYHSTSIARTRDSNFHTGVLRHDDADGNSKIRSTWDFMDHNDQARGTPQRTTGRSRAISNYSINETILGAGSLKDAVETKKLSRTPVRSKVRKTKLPPRGSLWISAVRYRFIYNATGDDEQNYEAYGLTVRLQFTLERVPSLQRLIGNIVDMSKTPPIYMNTNFTSTPRIRRKPTALLKLAAPRAATTFNSPGVLDIRDSVHNSPRFQRVWTDETRDFDMKKVNATLRSDDEDVPAIGPKYQWYTDAVPIDAIFPPGVPISAKEIQAYYPHHVRWKGVMLRLTENDYRGGDIMGIQAFFRGPPNYKTTIAQMNNFQHDAVKGSIPDFKTIGYKGKSDRDLFTDGLAVGQCVDQSRGFVVPTFDDLLRGLRTLPTGLDARSLTQCLEWYTQNRDTFSPRLQLNALHTQALYQALRRALKPFGPQNLDRNALKEWQDKGEYENTGLHFIRPQPVQPAENGEPRSRRSRLRVNIDEEGVELDIKLPLRYVLTFPFLALRGVVSEMFRLGISKAEARCAEHEGTEPQQQPAIITSTRPTKYKSVCMTPGTTPEAAGEGNAHPSLEQGQNLTLKEEAYRIPKRSRSIEGPPLSESSSKRYRSASQTQLLSPPVSRTPAGPRLMPAYISRQQPAASPRSPNNANTWYGSSPSSVPTQPHYSRYARRDDPSRGFTRPSNSNGYS